MTLDSLGEADCPRLYLRAKPRGFTLVWIKTKRTIHTLQQFVVHRTFKTRSFYNDHRKSKQFFEIFFKDWYLQWDSNPYLRDSKSLVSASWTMQALRRKIGTRNGIRTHTVEILNLLSPASWTMRAINGSSAEN